MNQFYPHGQQGAGGGGGYRQQADSFQQGLFNMMLSGAGKGSGKGGKDRPPPVRFFENQIHDLRKRRFTEDGEVVKISTDPDAEVLAIATEKGAGECMRLQRSILLHVRCGDDPRKAWVRARLTQRVLNLDMSDEKFPAFIMGLARLQEALGIEPKTVTQWIAENHPEDGVRRNLFPGASSSDDEDGIIQQLITEGRTSVIAGSSVPRPDLTMPPPSVPVATPVRNSNITVDEVMPGRVASLTSLHEISTPAMPASIPVEPDSGNPAPRQRQRTAPSSTEA